MTKTFFIVVPYSPPTIKSDPIKDILGAKREKGNAAEEKIRSFEEDRTQLDQRMAVVEQGLVSCGIRVVQLGTEELVEVFYKLFNPGDVEKPIHVG